MKSSLLLITVMTLLTAPVFSQTYTVSRKSTFTQKDGTKKKVLLLKQSANGKDVILFQTKLRVNTDGSPLSYHPGDPRGEEKALNNVCNAMSIVEISTGKNICFSEFSRGIRTFEKFRDSGWQVPAGFRITWQNVIPPETKDGRVIPCIFKSGEYKDYFGSLTSLKNGLAAGQRGECEAANQINPMKIPALVLVGGSNAVRNFGAGIGDLVVAYNPANNQVVAAVVGDSGPPNNLGEGSVALNMKLKGVTTMPTKRSMTYALNIEGRGVMVAIIPASRNFKKDQNIYSVENINRRIDQWCANAGFSGRDKLIAMMKSFGAQLD